MTDDGKRYWFRAKRYGYGWGFPSTWEGWLVFALFLALVIGTGALLPGAALPVTLVAAVGLIAVSYWKGEPPRWRWGKQRS